MSNKKENKYKDKYVDSYPINQVWSNGNVTTHWDAVQERKTIALIKHSHE